MDALIHALQEAFQNQLFAGGLALGIVGSVIAFCRNLPGRLFRWGKHQLTITSDVQSNDPIFNWLSLWLDSQPYSKRARYLSVSTTYNNNSGGPGEVSRPRGAPSSAPNPNLPKIIFTPAPGNHVFLYKRRVVWLSRERSKVGGDSKESSAFSFFRESYSVTILGRSQEVARELFEEVVQCGVEETRQRAEIHVNIFDYWQSTGIAKHRPLESVLLPDGIVETVLNAVNEFRESADWYSSIGIPHRIGFLFEGIPGSGKTSLIAALAGYLNISLYALNLSSEWLDDDNLTRLLNCVPNGSFILLEDIDAAFSGRKKEAGAKGLTFSGLLNALDGVASKDGNIVFMTTNHVERLDPALIRPGRADVRVHFDCASAEQIRQLYRRFFPDEDSYNADLFAEIFAQRRVSMAEVQQHLLVNRDSPGKAIYSLELAKEAAA